MSHPTGKGTTKSKCMVALFWILICVICPAPPPQRPTLLATQCEENSTVTRSAVTLSIFIASICAEWGKRRGPDS